MTSSVHHLQLTLWTLLSGAWCLYPGLGLRLLGQLRIAGNQKQRQFVACPFLPLRSCQEQTLGEQLPGAEHSDGAGLWGPVLQEWHAHSDQIVLWKEKHFFCGKGKKCPFVKLIWGGKEKTLICDYVHLERKSCC